MVRSPHTIAARLVVAMLLVAGLAACGDDDAATPATPTTDEPDGVALPDPGGPGDEPTADDVIVRVTGEIDQTFVGGACYVDSGFFHVVAGYATGVTPVREQVGAHPEATITIRARVEDGELGEGTPAVSILSSGADDLVIQDLPDIELGEGLLTGSFDGDQVDGDWTCSAVLTPDELQELQASNLN